jgi:uncharacterized repeat protein (TIGR01451 family)
MSRQRLYLGVLVGLLFVLQAAPAGAADRAFTARFSTNDTGNITIAANTLLTCPASDAACAGAQTGGALNNNQFTMRYVDTDSDASTFNSSSADLSLPVGATVLFAGLYWGGDTSAGNLGVAAPAAGSRGSVLLAAPGGGYSTVTASTLDGSSAAASRYQGVANVTAAVQAGGAGTYTVANVQAGTGQDRYAGWGLVVAYHDPAQPPRNLTIFDGLDTVSTATPTLAIPVSGFLTPTSGPVNTSLGFIAWEGDRGSTGDSAVLNSTTLSDAANPANNFFNSSISTFGTNVTTKSPNYVNQLGYDADLFNASGILPNGATSATIHLTTGGETYLPGVVTFATELFAPRLTPAKSAVDLNGGAVEQGDQIEYSIDATNTGQDGATNVVVTDPIPAHTTIVPGSLQIVSSPGGIAGSKTDAAGDDQAEISGSNVRFRLGAGANASTGGTIAPGQSYEVRFRVTIDTPTADQTVVTNSATGTYSAQSNPAFGLTDTSSPPTQLTVVAPDMVLAKSDSGNFQHGGSASFTLSASNSGSTASSGLVTVTDTVPSSLPVTGASGPGWSCNVVTQTATCTRSDAVAAGASYPDITIDVTVAPSAPGSITNTASVSGGADGDPSNNDASDTISVSSAADVAIIKSVSPADPVAGDPATFTLTVFNNGPSDATGIEVDDPLPAALTSPVVTPATGACSIVLGTVECSIASLASGQNTTIDITGTIDPSAAGTTLANTATVSANEPDPNGSNNSSSVSPTISGVADLGITKTMTPMTPLVGAPVSFTITTTNNGPSDATGVVVTDPLASQLTDPTATASQGTCTIVSAEVSCAIGALASGANATVTVTATIAAGSSGAVLSNTAEVSGNETDPNLTDNLANVTSKIEATTIQARKTTTTRTAKAGATVSYRLAVTVTGATAATNVTACDQPPAHTSYVDIDGGTVTAGKACWTFTSIAPGETVVRTVVLRIDRDAPAGPLRNLLITHTNSADKAADSATIDVEGVTPVSIPIVTG